NKMSQFELSFQSSQSWKYLYLVCFLVKFITSCQREITICTSWVYEAVVRATLLYGVETWVLLAADLRRLAVFDRGRLRWVAGVRGRRLGGAELETRTGLKRLEGVVVERRWRWLGHVLRLPESRWPRRVLEWSGGEEEGALWARTRNCSNF